MHLTLKIQNLEPLERTPYSGLHSITALQQAVVWHKKPIIPTEMLASEKKLFLPKVGLLNYLRKTIKKIKLISHINQPLLNKVVLTVNDTRAICLSCLLWNTTCEHIFTMESKQIFKKKKWAWMSQKMLHSVCSQTHYFKI